MRFFLVTMLIVGAAIIIARAIDNDRTLHVIPIVVGDAE